MEINKNQGHVIPGEKPTADSMTEHVAQLHEVPDATAPEILEPHELPGPHDFRMRNSVEDFARVVGPDVQKVDPASREYSAARYVMRDRGRFIGRGWKKQVEK